MSGSRPPADPELVELFNVPTPRYTSYPTVPEWSREFTEFDYGQALDRAGHEVAEPLSLYVHVPFCRELCLYCGCNVVVGRGAAVADRYLEQLQVEIGLASRRLGERRTVSRVHWGGGTPTYLDERQLRALWAALAAEFDILAEAERAIEVDPVVTTNAQLEVLAELGFGRLSMGVQDFDPTVQAAVRRVQSVDQTRALLDHARLAGFTSVNFDLIYGLPHQTANSWQRTLEQVVALGPDRLAVFSFAYIPGLRPHQRKLPSAALPTAATKLVLQTLTADTLGAAGYRAIGMDHYALPADELSLAQRERRLWRDFQGYTVRRANDTVALGPTGISDVGGAYAQSVRSLTRYRDALQAGRLPTERGMLLSPDDQRRRNLITQLMCNWWVDLDASGLTDLEPELAELATFAVAGLVRRDGSHLTVTSAGRPFIRNIAAVFDSYLRRGGERTFSRAV